MITFQCKNIGMRRIKTGRIQIIAGQRRLMIKDTEAAGIAFLMRLKQVLI
jgi:hypothetical protein